MLNQTTLSDQADQWVEKVRNSMVPGVVDLCVLIFLVVGLFWVGLYGFDSQSQYALISGLACLLVAGLLRLRPVRSARFLWLPCMMGVCMALAAGVQLGAIYSMPGILLSVTGAALFIGRWAAYGLAGAAAAFWIVASGVGYWELGAAGSKAALYLIITVTLIELVNTLVLRQAEAFAAHERTLEDLINQQSDLLQAKQTALVHSELRLAQQSQSAHLVAKLRSRNQQLSSQLNDVDARVATLSHSILRGGASSAMEPEGQTQESAEAYASIQSVELDTRLGWLTETQELTLQDTQEWLEQIGVPVVLHGGLRADETCLLRPGDLLQQLALANVFLKDLLGDGDCLLSFSSDHLQLSFPILDHAAQQALERGLARCSRLRCDFGLNNGRVLVRYPVVRELKQADEQLNALVWVCDDDPVQLLLSQRYLADVVTEIEVFSSFAELETVLAKSRRPDMMISDLHLPDTTGHQIRDALSEVEPYVVITGDDRQSERRRLLANGVTAVWQKGLSKQELQLRVRRLLMLKVSGVDQAVA